MRELYRDASPEELNAAMEASWIAFRNYRKTTHRERADLLREIASQLGHIEKELLEQAARETNLEAPRLKVEFNRTRFQLTSYADACAEGSWMELRIDTADPLRQPPKPDLRKMLVPLGPVVVFGASNFPFAYSTAGGDTACALAAGCSVVIKAHPAHPATSAMVAKAMKKALVNCGLSEDVLLHIYGASAEAGQLLAAHPRTRAVAFTGSFEGGKALFEAANKRKVPIPVFAEMGSVNPVFLLPEKLALESAAMAKLLAGSITQSVGQFCTNPGLMIAIETPALEKFLDELQLAISDVSPQKMLHEGIAKNYRHKRDQALEQRGVALLAGNRSGENEPALPAIAAVKADVFLSNPLLHKEVFGPFSLLVRCASMEEMLAVARSLEGQLTTSVWATMEEAAREGELLEYLQDVCGRCILNGVPTGVEVTRAMHHGGPFPATTDSRFTAVGADGIRRFARPVCFQNWDKNLLPAVLQDENPEGIWRLVNSAWTRSGI